jgi:hypothetical protein
VTTTVGRGSGTSQARLPGRGGAGRGGAGAGSGTVPAGNQTLGIVIEMLNEIVTRTVTAVTSAT